MSFASIKLKVQAKLGLDNQTLLGAYVNEAAEELWKTADLVGSLREMVLWYDGTNKQIALPEYVLLIRGVRYYNSQYQIPQNDMRPRYQIQGFGETSLNWRERFRGPFHTQITDQSTLTLVLPRVETSPVVVKIVGKTPNSSKLEETVTFAPGELKKETTQDWEEVYSITKNAPCLYNIGIFDANDVELGVIPNSELSPKYTVIQVLDDNIEGATQTSGVEVLYKPLYRTMINDGDQFQAEEYEDAIFWKTLELYYGREDDSEAVVRAKACQIKVDQLLEKVAKQFTSGKKLEMEIKPNKFYSIFRPRNWLGTKFRT